MFHVTFYFYFDTFHKCLLCAEAIVNIFVVC